MYVCSIVSRIPVWAGDAGESAVQRAVYGTLFFFPWALVFAVKKKTAPEANSHRKNHGFPQLRFTKVFRRFSECPSVFEI